MLDFNSTLLIQFFNFLILLILLNFLLFKPVLKALDKRSTALGAVFEKADHLKEDVKQLEKSYDEGMKERKKPILEQKDLALAEAHKTSMHLIEQARVELSVELEKVKGDVEKESKKASDALKAEVGKLSTEVAEKILRRSL